ncbi:MAG: tetratricopeptide repeat protein, partial [candidate division Zixibacteria bacterium]|nr:tetratricopeptide repeat protein [candidate division Zixibacteria bacterium]
KAVSIEPENAAFLDSYGWAFYHLGQHREALKQLKKAAELDNDPVIYDHLGDSYKAVGNMSQARQWWRKALEQDPQNKDIKRKLGN